LIGHVTVIPNVEAAQQDMDVTLDTLVLTLGRISDLESRFDECEAREAALERRIKAMEESFGPVGSRRIVEKLVQLRDMVILRNEFGGMECTPIQSLNLFNFYNGAQRAHELINKYTLQIVNFNSVKLSKSFLKSRSSNMAAEVPQTLEYRGGQLNSAPILEDFQDSPEDKEDTRNSDEYLHDLEEEYQARALLAKSSRLFKKDTQRFNSTKATNQTECYKCGRMEEVSSDDNEVVEVKVLMPLAEENDAVSKEGARNGEWVKIYIRKCISEQIPTQKKRILGVDLLTEDPSSLGQKDLVFVKSSAVDTKASIPATDYDSVNKSSVNSTPLPPLEKLSGAEPYDIRKPIWYLDSGCSRHMTRVKSYLHKYVEQPGPKVVFGDDSTCITEDYGSITCNGIFDEKRGTIFNSNKEIVMIAPRVRDVYICDMTSSEQESCFFVRASKNLNWLWHKRLAYLNLKTLNLLAKQNLVMGLPSLSYSKDKPCSSCEKGKHHRASLRTKQTFSIRNVVIFFTWTYLDLSPPGPLTMKSILLSLLMSTQGTLRNSILVNLCDEKGITQNFSSPYTPEQNGVTEAVATGCYTQNRSTIVKRHLKTLYEILQGRIPNIEFLHVFGCPVYIHKHKDYLGKFDEKVDDGYFLGYSLVSKAYRVFNTRKQMTEETYHITFVESTNAIEFTKPSVDNINIDELERYPRDEYHHYEPSQRYQINGNEVSFIEPYERATPVVLETEVPSDQNDHPAQ
ncbi:retrovirus-related pol polyprotein from transposon TNT 1-94, partial [Tanacetum coccineum]